MASGNIKWGMTVAEAKAAFPGLREPYQIIRQGAPDPCKVVDGSGGAWPQLRRAPSWRTRRASAVPTPNRLPIGLFRMRLGTVYADPARSHLPGDELRNQNAHNCAITG